MSEFTAKFGISGMVIWLFMTFQRMGILSGRKVAKSLLVMGIILLVLQGEAFLGFPLFLGLMFLYVPRYSCRDLQNYSVMRCLRQERHLVSEAGYANRA